ncbi:MAG: DUF885 domain-containing protein [Kineosporiaceae bacterium]
MTRAGDAGTAAGQVRRLADDLDALRWSVSPFLATYLGVPGHDADVDDVSAAAQARHREAATALLQRAEVIPQGALPAADAVTLETVRHAARGIVAQIDARLVDFSVGPWAEGPALVLQLAAVTAPADAAEAADYLTRCRRLGGYLDACADRLRQGTADGRILVAALAERTLTMIDGMLAADVAADPLLAVPAPPGWVVDEPWRAEDWYAEVADAVRDVVRPAVVRYRDLIADLVTSGRRDDQAGMVHLPGGAAAYQELVLLHTSLPLTAREVHDWGLVAVEALRDQMTEVGSRLGLADFDLVLAAARDAVRGVDPWEAIRAARAAIARAEAALPGWFPEPLPTPCRVEPMSPHLGKAGTAPYYSPPTDDGRRPGTYWFNVDQVGPGAGWDLESTAYHEAVPGHHLQTERMLTRTELPAVQRYGDATAHEEGWGLYAELVAEEMGLYSDDRQLLGALGNRIFRAARLVVDTGIHALGWSRSAAVTFLRRTVPSGDQHITAEVDRYIGWPGQALGYFVGLEEILRLRASARERLGERFDVVGFHAAVLDSGSIPLPALRRAVEAWLATRS